MKSSLWTFYVYLSLLCRVFEPLLGSLIVWHLLLFVFVHFVFPVVVAVSAFGLFNFYWCYCFLSGNAKQLFHLVFECFCPSRWNLARVSWMNSSRIFCCWSCGYVLFSFIRIVWLLIYLIRISFMVRQRLWALEGFFFGR